MPVMCTFGGKPTTKKVIHDLIGMSVIVAAVAGVMYFTPNPSVNSASQNEAECSIPTKPVSQWYVVHNKDGKYQLDLPRSTLYQEGSGDVSGDCTIAAAKDVYQIKDCFAKSLGNEKYMPWQCRIDDFNHDGIADKISWPRRDDMPEIDFRTYVSRDSTLQQKASRALQLEQVVDTYVSSKVRK